MRFSVQTVCFALSILAASRASQDPSHCPPAPCADPRYDHETSCFTCEGSQCVYRGCVHSGAFFATWRPDNCTVCHCLDKKEVCTTIECAPVECYGYPMVTRPGKCCPECDFNVSATECGAVPVVTRSLYVSLGDNSCQRDVVERDCDKRHIVDSEGAWFMCEPVREEVMQSFEDVPGCANRISHVTYKTVARCEKRRLSYHEIPQDYDPDPHRCSYYVDPQTAPGSPKNHQKPRGSKPRDPQTPPKLNNEY